MLFTDQLIEEYRENKRSLQQLTNTYGTKNPQDKEDKSKVNSMIDSMAFAIKWMETGRQPGLFRGIDKRGIYQQIELEEAYMILDIVEQIDINDKEIHLSDEQKQTLLQIFSNLSIRERQCYLMHVAEGLSMSRIANEIGISKRTVQQYIERAKQKVENIMTYA
ncbi:RNA polymerase sigma-70 factor (ECF subfamily) [Sinobaca qinghaiensis]|uniref:RNA polymerase sigma-70 factor (ECF subfamily) n=1 Tax=Sinobaca qinghaiensis TaxID=342944 RepID=A0A419V5W0_9BACL|nr:sigma-70 family RNA polymerase sigma factor [Sinobaca qinghaiensis]RKD75221.1 RNA polymerase sigma-70 factor (ECF subfamily) [Sinobaca qinghaiensis]